MKNNSVIFMDSIIVYASLGVLYTARYFNVLRTGKNCYHKHPIIYSSALVVRA